MRTRTRAAGIAAAVIALATALAGCSATTADDTVGAGDTAAVGDAFPVSVETPYGKVEIAEQPVRVIALSDDYLSPVVALGTTPVAYRTDGPNAAVPVGPWVSDTLEGKDIEVIAAGELDLEQIAALEPDLIAGPMWAITEDLFDRLSDIAPTIAHTDSGAGTELGAWEDQTRQIGAALGVSAEAEALIDEAKASIASVQADYPNSVGRTITAAYIRPGQVAFINSPDASAAKLFGGMGFSIPIIDPSQTGERAGISLEQLALLDNSDMLIMAATSPEIADELAANPLYQQLTVVKEGRVLDVDMAISSGFNEPNAVSIPYLIDMLAPVLATL